MLASDVNSQVEGIKEKESVKNYLTLEEAVVLYGTPCRKDLVRRAGLFSLLTGLRYSDIEKLEWNEIHTSGGQFYIGFRQQKTQDNEMMPIPEQAYFLLPARGKNERIFEGLKKWDVDRMVPLWIADAGITKHITFHCFRHTYATLQIAAGRDIFTVSKMLGHKNIKTTQVYTKLVDDKKIQASGKIVLE